MMWQSVRKIISKKAEAVGSKKSSWSVSLYQVMINQSDRQSVTRWYCVKTTRATIVRSSLKDNPTTLVYTWLTWAYMQGVQGTEPPVGVRGLICWGFAPNCVLFGLLVFVLR